MTGNLSKKAPPRKSKWMDHALELAHRAAILGEVPVGAVVVGSDGTLLGEAHNQTLTGNDPTAHAEILAIRRACKTRDSQRLSNCDLYVTLEPCAMCAAAISFARLRRLYFGTADPKGGAVENGARFFSSDTCHHAPDVYGGIGERKAGAMLQQFFKQRR